MRGACEGTSLLYSMGESGYVPTGATTVARDLSVFPTRLTQRALRFANFMLYFGRSTKVHSCPPLAHFWPPFDFTQALDLTAAPRNGTENTQTLASCESAGSSQMTHAARLGSITDGSAELVPRFDTTKGEPWDGNGQKRRLALRGGYRRRAMR